MLDVKIRCRKRYKEVSTITAEELIQIAEPHCTKTVFAHPAREYKLFPFEVIMKHINSLGPVLNNKVPGKFQNCIDAQTIMEGYLKYWLPGGAFGSCNVDHKAGPHRGMSFVDGEKKIWFMEPATLEKADANIRDLLPKRWINIFSINY